MQNEGLVFHRLSSSPLIVQLSLLILLLIFFAFTPTFIQGSQIFWEVYSQFVSFSSIPVLLLEGFFLSEWHEFITPPTPDRASDSVRFFRISAADDAAEHAESSALLKKKKNRGRRCNKIHVKAVQKSDLIQRIEYFPKPVNSFCTFRKEPIGGSADGWHFEKKTAWKRSWEIVCLLH